MRNDVISEIGIDKEDRLYIKPLHEEFPFIYREAMGVHWDSDRHVLFSSKPQEWSYLNWYVQIISAAKEQGVILSLSSNTVWQNISDEFKTSFINYKF